MSLWPDLLRAAVVGYPVIDMLRFHRLHIGSIWIPEYGDPQDPGDRAFLESYSPYQRLGRGVRYPPILIYTGLNDDRVHPAHALELHARLKELGQENYLRVETASGHMGARLEVRAGEASDFMAFLYVQLGMAPGGLGRGPGAPPQGASFKPWRCTDHVAGLRLYTDRIIMTPGPSEIPHRIRAAMIRETTNPDLDPEFLETYNRLRDKLSKILGVERGSLYIIPGEAVLGLEAAIANTVRPGDRVIVVSNGVYGEGFADIVRLYGGEPVQVSASSWSRSFDPSELERALERDRGARAVTLVHCDTPSALLNDLEEASKIARSFGVLLIVDAVSSIGASRIDFSARGLGILVGGSQKALNAPAGLTIVAISPQAWEAIEERGYRGLYMDLRLWREMLDGKGVFPYTMSDVLVHALDEAASMILEEGLDSVFRRHEASRRASRTAAEALGLEIFTESLECTCPSVTAIKPPEGVEERRLREIVWKRFGVMLAGSWGRLEGRILRVGHMGVQASRSHLIAAYTALARGLSELGFRASPSKAVEAIEEAFS